MKACVLEGIGNLVYKDVPMPGIKQDEVLLEIKACGICSSDIPRIYETGTYHFPTIPGHEFAGKIVETGDEVDKTLLGMNAAVFPLIPCGECPSCLVAEYARCDNYNYYGSRCDGAYAEYIAVKAWNLIPFSPNLSYTNAALCEPTAVAKHCVDAGMIHIGDAVVVIGTGTIGLLAASWARLNGASEVIVVGHSMNKCEFAQDLGFTACNSSAKDIEEFIKEKNEGKLADVVLECVGNSASIEEAICACKKGGTVVLTGNPDKDIVLSKKVYWKILRNELHVRGTWNSSYSMIRNDWKVALRNMEQETLPIASLISHTFPLRDYQKALDTVRNKDILSIKVMFDMTL